jgi:uncharacterized membrane protein
MAKKSRKEEVIFTEEDKTCSFLITFLSIVGFIIWLFTKRENKYVKFYAKQSLIVFIACILLSIVGNAFLFIDVIGKVISFASALICALIWIFSWIYALSGEKKEVPLIGHYAEKIKL